MGTGAAIVESILGATGWTQSRLVYEIKQSADELNEPPPEGLDLVTVNRWKKGRQEPSRYYLRLLQHLHVSVHQATLGPATRTRQPGRVKETMKRREFLAYAAALAAASIVDPERLAVAREAKVSADGALLDGLEATTRAYAGRWHETMPQVLLPVVRRHLSVLNELRMLPQPAPTARRLHQLTADAASLLGWLQNLGGDRTAAEAYYALACDMAREGGDSDIQGFVLVARSFHSARLSGWPTVSQALTTLLLDQAAVLTRGTRSPLLRTFVLTRRAEELAAAADAAAAYRSLELAERVIAGVRGGADGFFRYFDANRLAGSRGTVAMLLGEPAEAIEVLTGTLDSAPASLLAERSVLMTDLGAAHAQRGEIEHAVDLLSRSLAHGASVFGRRKRVLAVRRSHLSRWAHMRSVRRLDEQLQSLANPAEIA
jgi:hypothetical protein